MIAMRAAPSYMSTPCFAFIFSSVMGVENDYCKEVQDAWLDLISGKRLLQQDHDIMAMYLTFATAAPGRT